MLFRDLRDPLCFRVLFQVDAENQENHVMAKLICGMNVSLDGYVDHTEFAPDPVLFRHFIQEAAGQTGSVYGRTMYELMRYWDDEQPSWGDDERAFAAAWRKQKKWVVSRTLNAVGPNAERIGGDLDAALRAIKTHYDGEIEVAGPQLAQSVSDLGLIDEYRLYLHPLALGRGAPFFRGPRPPMRLVSHDRIGENVLRLRYKPG